MAYDISDATDASLTTGNGPSLIESLDAIGKSVCRRIEQLADAVAYSRGARTEQGKPFSIYTNGLMKAECELSDHKPCGLSSLEQITAAQECAQELFEVVLANKPTNASLLVWRAEPELRRTLFPDGLKLQFYTRLTWVKLREDHN